MLVLTRLIGERVVIGESIVIEVVLTLPEVDLGPKGE